MSVVIATNLKMFREANRLSKEQVSLFLGIKRSAYANYESGDREAPLDVLEKASDLFGCELCLLFEENSAIVENMLTCAFRIDDLSASDMAEVASFKNIVKNYLKIKSQFCSVPSISAPSV